VNEGELWFEKELVDSMMSARPRHSLTRREGQLVVFLTQGLKNKEIATALGISEGTVKVYLSHLFQKLDVKDRFELAVYGLKNLAAGAGAHEADGLVRNPPPYPSLHGADDRAPLLLRSLHGCLPPSNRASSLMNASSIR
jgi:DNA-binding CsgD family transcriptional regulator